MKNLFSRTPRQINRHQQSGFSLVELSVVLAVIGLIVGAIAIGKDVQRNAEYTKVKNKFIDQWEQAYNQHYQRTGVVVGDSQIAPRLMVNGSSFAGHSEDASVLSGNNMTGEDAPGRVCDKAVGADMSTRSGEMVKDLRDRMLQAGVRLPPGRAEGFEDRYVYLDSNGNPQEVQVCFQWNKPGMPEGSGNVMIISGLTPDLARMLDQMVDGKPDALEGRFRQQAVIDTAGIGNQPGELWNRTNVDSMTTLNSKRDEDQVATVVAIYKMNQ